MSLDPRATYDLLTACEIENAKLRADNERLRAELEEWKERWAAERRDHEATIRHFDKLMNEVV